MRFCVAESLLGVLTGEVGVGKTVALRAAASAGKALVDDDCAKKAVAELTRE